MRRRGDDWRLLARTVSATDYVLAKVYGVRKAKKKSVLTRVGFDEVVRDLVGKLTTITGPEDAAALRTAAKKLDRRWDALSAAERDRVIAAAAKGLLDVPKIVAPKVVDVLRSQLPGIVLQSKILIAPGVGAGATPAGAKEVNIGASLSAQDERIVKFAASSQGAYITDQYGVRATAYEQRARDIVSRGVAAGLGRDDISERLHSELTTPMLGRGEAYWDQVASIHVARARSYGQLAGLDDAGIERFVVSASLDEVTCVMCRFMNGKTFSTGDALQRYQDVEESGDPYAVTHLQPFLRVGRSSDDDGGRFLFVSVKGKDHHVADVEDDATGRRDDAGAYSNHASEEKLQGLGVASPPFHGSCRCLVEPA
jgi:hypothetical protein